MSHSILFSQELFEKGRFRKLSVIDKLVYLHLFLGSQNNWVGLFDYQTEDYSDFFPIEKEELIRALRSLHVAGFICYAEDRNVVYIKGFSGTQRAALRNKNFAGAIIASVKKHLRHMDFIALWMTEHADDFSQTLRVELHNLLKDRMEQSRASEHLSNNGAAVRSLTWEGNDAAD